MDLVVPAPLHHDGNARESRPGLNRDQPRGDMAITSQGYTFDLNQDNEPGSVLLFVPLVFVLPGAGLVFFGLYIALLCIEAAIGGCQVTIKRRVWFCTRSMTVLLKDYPGVLRKRVTYRRNKRTYITWIAALPHDDKARRVVLGASRDEARGRRLAEVYARLLDMPALEETVDGFVACAPEDVACPLAELAAEGKVMTGYRSGKTAPAEVHVETGPDMIIVSFLKARMPLWLVAVLVGMVGVIRSIKARRQLIVPRDRVFIAVLGNDGKELRISAELMLAEIKGLRIDRGQYGGNALWFDTDRGSFAAGDHSLCAALDYVRDLVIAALAMARDGRDAVKDAQA